LLFIQSIKPSVGFNQDFIYGSFILGLKSSVCTELSDMRINSVLVDLVPTLGDFEPNRDFAESQEAR
jgi:hypothetical protein